MITIVLEALHSEIPGGRFGAYESLCCWEQDETCFIAAKPDLLYLRVLKIGNEWVVSRDTEHDATTASNEGERR